MSSGTQRPDGVEFNELSAAVFDILAQFTAFPWPIMLAQCKRVGANPSHLTPEQLASALPHLAAGVGRFTDPTKAVAVTRLLQPLTK